MDGVSSLSTFWPSWICLCVPCGLAGLWGLAGKSDHLAPVAVQGKQGPDHLPGLLRAPTSANTWTAQARLGRQGTLSGSCLGPEATSPVGELLLDDGLGRMHRGWICPRESDTQPIEQGMAVPVLGANTPRRWLVLAEEVSS